MPAIFFKRFFLSFFFLAHTIIIAIAQDNPVEHMRQFTEREEMLSQKYLSYMSEVAHGGRARKMEKRRSELMNAVNESVREAMKLRPYKGDASLRDAYKTYWELVRNVINDDYHKVVDMEEVAERSYDAMEAYLLIQEKAEEKLSAAYDNVATSYRSFADKHNVKLIDGSESKLSKKVGQAAAANHYLNDLFLISFKSSVQEAMMLEGLNKLDVNAVEQAKGSMVKFAAEGLVRLDTTKTFKGDGSMVTACRKILEFHKAEAAKISVLTLFIVKKEEFEKFKKSFDAKPANKRVQADVDTYNTLLSEYNSGVSSYNKTNTDLNEGRSKAMDNWEKTRSRFLAAHVPHN